jgi:tetratricopeptide (TPR) repeat protein
MEKKDDQETRILVCCESFSVNHWRFVRLVRQPHPPIPFFLEFLTNDFWESNDQLKSTGTRASDARLFVFDFETSSLIPATQCETTRVYRTGSVLVIQVGKEPPDRDSCCSRASGLRLSELSGRFYSQGFYASSLTASRYAFEFCGPEYITLLFKLRLWKELQEIVPVIPKSFPNDTELAYISGICLEKNGAIEEAIQEFRRGLAPGCIEHVGLLARLAQLWLTYRPHDFDLRNARLMIIRAIRVHLDNDLYLARSIAHCLWVGEDRYTAISVAFRNRYVLKHFAKLMHKDAMLSRDFVTETNRSPFEASDIVGIAEVLYSQGRVEESLAICDPHYRSIYVSRFYLLLLLNEGLYRRFCQVAVDLCNFCIKAPDFAPLELGEFVADFQASCMAIADKTSPRGRLSLEYGDMVLTERQNAYLDVLALFPVYLFLVGNLKRIDVRPFPVDARLPYWRLRQLFENVHAVLANKNDQPAPDFGLKTYQVIGDDVAVFPCYYVLRTCKLVPKVICELSLWEMRPKHKSGVKSSFWTRIGQIDTAECAGVMLLLGNKDCEFEVPRLIKRCKFQTVSLGINFLMSTYLTVLTRMKRRFPQITVFVHPAISRELGPAPIVFEFNRQLRQLCTDHHIVFLDIFPAQKPLDLDIDGRDMSRYEDRLKALLKELK